jgi:hypothetical protein
LTMSCLRGGTLQRSRRVRCLQSYHWSSAATSCSWNTGCARSGRDVDIDAAFTEGPQPWWCTFGAHQGGQQRFGAVHLGLQKCRSEPIWPETCWSRKRVNSFHTAEVGDDQDPHRPHKSPGQGLCGEARTENASRFGAGMAREISRPQNGAVRQGAIAGLSTGADDAGAGVSGDRAEPPPRGRGRWVESRPDPPRYGLDLCRQTVLARIPCARWTVPTAQPEHGASWARTEPAATPPDRRAGGRRPRRGARRCGGRTTSAPSLSASRRHVPGVGGPCHGVALESFRSDTETLLEADSSELLLDGRCRTTE